MSRRIDLNAARAARAEAQQEPSVVVIGDDEFTLVSELPIDFVTLISEGRLRESARLLFPEDADAEFDRFMQHRPTVSDLEEIAKGVTGLGEGESSASQRSSKTSGKRSRPTSKATTA